MTSFEDLTSQNKTTGKEIQKQREQFNDEIQEYESLLEQLKGVEGIKLELTSHRESLAFLIEEMKQKNPEGWQDDLKKIKERLDQTAKQEGEVGVKWVLSETISSTYIVFLSRRQEEVLDKNLKRKIEIMKKMAKNSLEFNRRVHEQGQPVAFGGVSRSYIPEWYYYVEK
jgi:hypothetical protein